MNKIKLLVLFLVTLLVFAGCSSKPSGDPKLIVEDYWQAMLDNNYEKTYGMMGTQIKNNVSLDDFEEYYLYVNEAQSFKSFQVTEVKEISDYTNDGVAYEYAFEVSVSVKGLFKMDSSEFTVSTQLFVVNEDNKWVILDVRDFGQLKANALNYVGNMYLEGKGKEKDINQAIQLFLRGIESDPNNPALYYGVASAYMYNGNYDKSLEYCATGIGKTSGSEQSSFFNLMGYCYESKYDYISAIVSYEEALKIDSTNAYAEQNLRRVKEYI